MKSLCMYLVDTGLRRFRDWHSLSVDMLYGYSKFLVANFLQFSQVTLNLKYRLDQQKNPSKCLRLLMQENCVLQNLVCS